MKLPQSPSGFIGQLFGKLMEWTNADPYHKALQTLAPSDNDRFLEIGFGTGCFAEMLLSTTTNTFVTGIDPTETMVKTASNRLIKKGLGDRIDLRQGTDDSLPWGDDRFDAIIAIHCFQFWQNPDRSLTEISQVLRPQGRIIMVFRDHSNRAPDWLPNPLSRSGKEVDLAIELLEKYGYTVVEYRLPPVGYANGRKFADCSSRSSLLMTIEIDLIIIDIETMMYCGKVKWNPLINIRA